MIPARHPIHLRGSKTWASSLGGGLRKFFGLVVTIILPTWAPILPELPLVYIQMTLSSVVHHFIVVPSSLIVRKHRPFLVEIALEKPRKVVWIL